MAQALVVLAWSLFGVAALTLVLVVIEVRRRRWRWLILPLALAMGCLIWAFIIMLRWPAVATVQINQSIYEAEPITSIPVVGTFFSLAYPSNWELDYHDQTASARFREKFQVSVAKPHQYRFVVSVETPTEAFDSIPAIQSRRLDLSGEYDEGLRQVAGRTMTEFWLESGGFERTVFWLNSGKLYVASLTSPNRTGEGDALFDQYVATLSLK